MVGKKLRLGLAVKSLFSLGDVMFVIAMAFFFAIALKIVILFGMLLVAILTWQLWLYRHQIFAASWRPVLIFIGTLGAAASLCSYFWDIHMPSAAIGSVAIPCLLAGIYESRCRKEALRELQARLLSSSSSPLEQS